MPMVYAYGRASTGKQTLTESHQRQACEEHIQRAVVPAGFTYGGWLYDAATTGSKPMLERDEGRKLWALVQPGDKIVWAKLDRAFRSVVDAAQTMAILQQKGVAFHSLDLGLDTSTPIGRCVLTILAAFAELELEFIRQRTRDGLRAKRREGRPYSRHAPIGWRKIGRKGESYYLPDDTEREQVKQMVAMRQGGHSLESITLAMRGVCRPNGYAWNINSVTRALKAAKARFAKDFATTPAQTSAVAG